ncbi:MAG: hypothetical protein KDB61_11355 [Planctomycetes bacterium]|nr:hypothetical protein [Planctomycetota bacterium]
MPRWESGGCPFQVLRVPKLAERRHELPTWISSLARQARPELEWSEEALAILWRQDWPGQESQLASIVGRLVQAAGTIVTPEEVQEALLERGVEPVIRLDSKRPWPEDVAAALHATRRKSGRWNKSRASQWLGWDPDTLVARMRDLGWQDGDVPTPDPWMRRRTHP